MTDREDEEKIARERPAKVTRRAAVKGLLAAGAAGTSIWTAKNAGAQDAVGGTKAPDDAITAADIAVSDKVAGRSYSEEERTLMVRSAGRMRESLKSLRSATVQTLLETDEPAVYFDPRLPGSTYPVPNRKASGSKDGTKVRLSPGPVPPYDGHPESLAFASVVDLSRLLRARKITSVELTRMYIDRLKKYGPRLNCVVTLTEEHAMHLAERADRELAAGKSRGPLHGIPWGAKDLLFTKGIRTTFGAKPFENQVFDYNATVVERLEEAGAVLVAKLSMGELAMGDVWYGGRTRNPWKPSNGSSGSSAGPGSATAGGLVGFSIGSETLGSIVSPSVVNGTTGLRPTFGRVSRYGAMTLAYTMDKLGPMCRGVEDCSLVLGAIYGPDGKDRTAADVPFDWNPTAKLSNLRIGYDANAFEQVAKEAKRGPVYTAALDTIRGFGVTLKPVKMPAQNRAYAALTGIIIDVESSAAFQKLTLIGKLSELAQQFENSWPNTFRLGSTIPAADYLTAMRVRYHLQQEVAEALRDVDCYVTLPFANLAQTNLTGHPTLVTRCGMIDGLPAMIEFTGNLYREDAILRLGLAYEQATPHHKQWPDLEKTLATMPA